MLAVKAVVALVVAAAAVTTNVQAERIGVNCTLTSNDLIDSLLNAPKCNQNHICRFDEDKQVCELDVSAVVTMQDGSHNKTQQPLLDPKDWFLTTEEITKSRDGHERNGLQTFTDGNDVRAFASSDEYFLSAMHDIERTGRGKTKDRIYMVGWGIADVPFAPLDSSTNSSLTHLIGGAVGRGVDVNALFWANPNPSEFARADPLRDWMNSLATPKGTTAKFIFDDRLAYPHSSHHQKILVIQAGNDLVAYVGGVDVTVDRWDTRGHDQKDLRKKAGIADEFNGWVDAHLRLHGPAAFDVAANVEQRWNSADQTGRSFVANLTEFKNAEYDDVTPIDRKAVTELPKNGTQHVQARLKAIANAKNYIYIEDQYFINVPELQKALLEVLPRIQRLIIVIQRMTKGTDLAGYGRYQLDMIAPLQQRFPNKVQLYSTKESRNVYIHSKVLVIDDVFLSVGSSNWNKRSMTSDSEIGANIIDSHHVLTRDDIKVAKLAHHFRVQKFQEHTGLPFHTLAKMPFIEAANALDNAAHKNDTVIEHLLLKNKAYFDIYDNDTQDLVDPDDRCGSETLLSALMED
ncbi:TPA: hypothetical protein N0F65_010619 [Lagenidium giganteum]|uniref:phospholipase D n=1 Tax=Lagenidium giganteum TaxID=4803 RepID=A0AAV2ZCE5_9STRA|nr:TPA: hypothetical protein N0F65_010619 [Lagenidium giganteum]